MKANFKGNLDGKGLPTKRGIVLGAILEVHIKHKGVNAKVNVAPKKNMGGVEPLREKSAFLWL